MEKKLDPDIVRTDLLKIKRKIYLSYPENSEERKNFLTASKLAEISYLSSFIPQDLYNALMDEYKMNLKRNLGDILLYFMFGGTISYIAFVIHLLWPKTSLAYCLIGLIIFLNGSFKPLKRIYNTWSKIKPVRKDYLFLQEKINELKKDLK